ncbi:unnamed protein product, partial [Prunus brigantina]
IQSPRQVGCRSKTAAHYRELAPVDYGALPHHAVTNLCKIHGPIMKLQLSELLSLFHHRKQEKKINEIKEVWDLIEFIASSEGRSINLSDKIYTMTSDFQGSIW